MNSARHAQRRRFWVITVLLRLAAERHWAFLRPALHPLRLDRSQGSSTDDTTFLISFLSVRLVCLVELEALAGLFYFVLVIKSQFDGFLLPFHRFLELS